MRRYIARALMLVSLTLHAVPAAAGGPETQLWGNLTLDWIRSHRLTLGAAIEPKVLVSHADDAPGWTTLDMTPSVEYTHGSWSDIVGELLVARTRQTDDSSSTEITPRIGLRLHILSNLKNDVFKERLPKRRLVLRTLLRFEWRHLSYSDDTKDSSSFRARERVELLYPINRRRTTDNGATYLTGDAEWFWTANDVKERYASKQRVRAGIGHRRNYAWRAETFVIWDRSRHASPDGFTTADYALEIRVRHVW